MRWKYTKLLMNLANSIEATVAPDPRVEGAGEARAGRGRGVPAPAGIDFASADEDKERRGDRMNVRPVNGEFRGGGSSWQSLARGTGSIETDYLNGEIVMLGRMHGVPTPANELMQRVANEQARRRAAEVGPGRYAARTARLVDLYSCPWAVRGVIFHHSPSGAPVSDSEQPVEVGLYGVTKRFGDMVAVDDVTIEVERGEFFSLLGPSGCGKTTSLRMIAGFEEPDAGRVELTGRDIVGAPPFKRNVNTVFQSYALFPHLTVADNVAFGLRRKKVSKSDIRDRVKRYLDLVQLRGYDERRPSQLSGGQQQASRSPGRW